MKRSFFYLHVTDNTSGQLVAFNLAHVYINPDLTPVVDYSLSTNGSEIFIDDLVIEGQRNSTSWRIIGQYQEPKCPLHSLQVHPELIIIN